MPDRYEIHKLEGVIFTFWELRRIDDDSEFGFNKLVGTFSTKSDAEKVLAQIKDHPDMNFAEWFFPQPDICDNVILDVNKMEKHCHKLWRALSGHHSVDQVRAIMDGVMDTVAYVESEYKQHIDDLETGLTAQKALDIG